MSKRFFAFAFAIGLAAVAWVALGFAGTSSLALAVTAVIAAVYLFGAFELTQFRAATAGLASALADVPQPLPTLGSWIERVPPALRNAVRLRIEGDRGSLPGPSLTPYLVGLLVMLGMLGTFLGMVVTFKGAVFALEGSTDLQAIRSALAEPIKGLGLSFGTSVAGVAASAMLGLMSAISRRERLEVARQLDSLIAGVLQPFSAVHQRQETFRALQLQARALPDVMEKLDALMQRIEQRSAQLDDSLLQRHAAFQREATASYQELARHVGSSLTDSLAAGSRAAGESIRPALESAMARIVQDSHDMQQRLGELAKAQVDAVSQQFGETARSVSSGWTAAVQEQARGAQALTAGLQRSLSDFTQTFEQRSAALVAAVDEKLARTRSEQAQAEHQRLQQWSQALQGMAAELQDQWRRAGDESIAQQQAVRAALEQAAAQVTERASAQAVRTLEDAARLLETSRELVQSRSESEARWMEQHAQRMDQLAGLWRTELSALRQEEAARGDAAVERLGELQAAVAQHLATLGAALEAPITRLLNTAAEVPQAAAGVIAQLRAEMNRVAERDNLALQERTVLLEQLGALLQALDQASGEQRAAIERMVTSASSVLAEANERFLQTVDAQAARAGEMAAQATGSAVELASLAEAFSQGVQVFQESSEKLTETLQRVESSIQRSTARSDEQLAYYVAQAREVIDLSIASQHGLVENLRQLQAQPAKPVALVAGARG